MPVRRISDTTVEYNIGALFALVHTWSKYVTVTQGEITVGTMCRKGAIIHNKPEWTVYDKTGNEILSHDLPSVCLHALRRHIQ